MSWNDDKYSAIENEMGESTASRVAQSQAAAIDFLEQACHTLATCHASLACFTGLSACLQHNVELVRSWKVLDLSVNPTCCKSWCTLYRLLMIGNMMWH